MRQWSILARHSCTLRRHHLSCVNGQFLRATPVHSDVTIFPHFDTACVFVDFEADTLAAFSWLESGISIRFPFGVVFDCPAHSPRPVVGTVVMQYCALLTRETFLFRIIQAS